MLRVRHTLRNEGADGYRLDELGCVLPLPPVATELLDLTGRWCRERAPQRRALGLGTWLRETRHGRTGHDAPLLTVAGTPGFGFRSGEVWGIHLGWSGDAAVWAERLPAGPGCWARRSCSGRTRSCWRRGRSTRRRGCTRPGRTAGSTG